MDGRDKPGHDGQGSSYFGALSATCWLTTGGATTIAAAKARAQTAANAAAASTGQTRSLFGLGVSKARARASSSGSMIESTLPMCTASGLRAWDATPALGAGAGTT